MNHMGYPYILAAFIYFFSHNPAIAIFGGKRPDATPAQGIITYLYLKDQEKILTDLGKSLKGRKKLNESEITAYKELATTINKIYTDLFTSVAENKTTTKIEPYKYLSYATQAQLFKELNNLGLKTKEGLEKAISTYGTEKVLSATEKVLSATEKVLSAKEIIKIRNILNNTLSSLSSAIKKVTDYLESLKKTLTFNAISQAHKEVKKWGNFKRLTLKEDNYLLKELSAATREKTLEDKAKTLQELKKQLEALFKTEKEVEQRIYIQDLITTLQEELASVSQEKGQPKPYPAGKTTQASATASTSINPIDALNNLNIELSALEAQLQRT